MPISILLIFATKYRPQPHCFKLVEILYLKEFYVLFIQYSLENISMMHMNHEEVFFRLILGRIFFLMRTIIKEQPGL
jgi:hypothetical protein